MKFYDDEHKEGVDISAQEMGQRFRDALATRGTEGDPSAPVKAFLFYNASPIIDFLMGWDGPSNYDIEHDAKDDLSERVSAALDLLDRLVDPLLDVSVCKSRVVGWKQMMRDIVVTHD